VKILQVTAPREFAILDVPIPTPGPGQVLIRISAVTTCPQWDLHLRHDEPMFVGHRFHYPYPAGQPGHEATGVIEAVGPDVTDLAPGDRVSAWRDAGHHVLGCYAQYVAHDAPNVIKVPAWPSDQALAPLELAMCVGTCFRMLGEMDAVRGRRFGVVGLGPAGMVAVQMAVAEGASEVYGFDPIAPRRELALSIGASACLDPTTDISSQFPMRTAGEGLDCGIDCVGARASVQFLMDHTLDAVALFGVQREEYTYSLHHGGIRLCGYKGHSRASAEYAVDLIRQGKLDLQPLVSHSLPLERYGEGIDLLEERQATKVCFLPWES
jgi:threonine dehydrogenase-like Zn-dependent dehydrogenase